MIYVSFACGFVVGNLNTRSLFNYFSINLLSIYENFSSPRHCRHSLFLPSEALTIQIADSQSSVLRMAVLAAHGNLLAKWFLWPVSGPLKQKLQGQGSQGQALWVIVMLVRD